MSVDAGTRAWLRRCGAEAIEHPGGTLYAHLCRVQERLAALGSDVDTQRAGLAHAVYGTDGFDLALLDWTDRKQLRDLIGDDAEALVYLYGACDRRRTWRDLATTGEVFDRFTKELRTLAPVQLQPFVDLSIVNELDVFEHDRSVVDEHGAYFRALFAAWAPVASPQVVGEALRVLGR
jgi:hypothetical protein